MVKTIKSKRPLERDVEYVTEYQSTDENGKPEMVKETGKTKVRSVYSQYLCSDEHKRNYEKFKNSTK